MLELGDCYPEETGGTVRGQGQYQLHELRWFIDSMLSGSVGLPMDRDMPLTIVE